MGRRSVWQRSRNVAVHPMLVGAGRKTK